MEFTTSNFTTAALDVYVRQVNYRSGANNQTVYDRGAGALVFHFLYSARFFRFA